jgi:hypothetical protein
MNKNFLSTSSNMNNVQKRGYLETGKGNLNKSKNQSYQK